MAVAIRYLVPYQVDIRAIDLTSLKPIQNTFYYKCGVQSGSPPLYGAPIPGPSDNAAFLAAFKASWVTNMMAVLQENYSAPHFTSRAILGKQYASPLVPISGVNLTLPITISTSGPHGFDSGDMVAITGVTTPFALNGNWTATVTSPTSLEVDAPSMAGPWSGNGFVQVVTSRLQFTYADLTEDASAAVGGIDTSEALPNYVSIDVRRLNPGVGKSFRSRFALGLISEGQQANGSLIGAAQTALNTALTAFFGNLANGGTDAGSGLMRQYALSRKLAFAQVSPFTASNTFTEAVSAFNYRVRLGSTVSRKPRLI